jgi:hypothetical protein
MNIEVDNVRVQVFDPLKRDGTVPRHAGYAPEVISIIFVLYQSLSLIY